MNKDRFNILYHHRTQGKGVEGVHVREMVYAWKRQGYKVDMVEPAGVSACAEVAGKQPSLIGRINSMVSRYVPEIIFELFEILYNVSSGNRLNKVLNKNHYGFIYERYAFLNWCGVWEARKTKTPIILEVNYTSYTPLYRKRCSILKQLTKWIEKWVFKNANAIIVVSKYLEEQLNELGVNKNKIIVLTNAADPERFVISDNGNQLREKYNLTGKTIIGFVGGFYPWHGLDFLFKAFKTLNENNNDVALLLIGDGPMAKVLKKNTLESGLENKIIFTGQLSHKRLIEYISVVDIAVMPHSNEYGSPMKIYEYMAMCKPVVAPRLGPLEDGITHGVEGLLFKLGNIEEFVVSLKTLINDKHLCEKMGTAGRERVLRQHNWQKNARAVIELFDSLNTGI